MAEINLYQDIRNLGYYLSDLVSIPAQAGYESFVIAAQGIESIRKKYVENISQKHELDPLTKKVLELSTKALEVPAITIAATCIAGIACLVTEVEALVGVGFEIRDQETQLHKKCQR